jgi:hypothetical protein
MTGFELGQWRAVCDRCGGEFKARQLRLEWTGLRVCHGVGTHGCWEPRNVQEKVKGVKDRQAPPWVRPEPPEIDVSPGSGNEVGPGDL